MNEKFDFLPLGSIVVVSGGIKRCILSDRKCLCICGIRNDSNQ